MSNTPRRSSRGSRRRSQPSPNAQEAWRATARVPSFSNPQDWGDFGGFGIDFDAAFHDTNYGSPNDLSFADDFPTGDVYPDLNTAGGYAQNPYFVDGSQVFQPDPTLDLATQQYARRQSMALMGQPLIAMPGADPMLAGFQDLHDQQFNAYGANVPPTDALGMVWDDNAVLSPPHLADQLQVQQVQTQEQPPERSRRTSTSSGTGARMFSRHSSWSVSDASERTRLRKSRHLQHRTSVYKPLEPEKPKVDQRRPWVRINQTTQGLTTRTAKINQFKAGHYENRRHPLGTWSSSKFTWEYTKEGEWSERTYTAKQILDFIVSYPRDVKGARLKLWMQKGPTDSARRYPSSTWSKCRFRDCPAQINQTGTILHGHYRVAFDEKWHRDRENHDPFLTAGYVHLYCMERFLDFPSICKSADIEVDDRSLTQEPKAHFAATLAGAPEASIAQSFIEGCRSGTLHKVPEFATYPQHKDYHGGAPKPHKDTLTYWMTKIKADSRPPAQRRQFERRGLRNSHLVVNLGDLEMLFSSVDKQRKVRRARIAGENAVDDEQVVVPPGFDNVPPANKRKRKQRSVEIVESDEENSEAEEWNQQVKRNRRIYAVDDDDASDDDLQPRRALRQGTRRSPRSTNKRQTTYTENTTDDERKQDSLFLPESHHAVPPAGPRMAPPTTAYAPPTMAQANSQAPQPAPTLKTLQQLVMLMQQNPNLLGQLQLLQAISPMPPPQMYYSQLQQSIPAQRQQSVPQLQHPMPPQPQGEANSAHSQQESQAVSSDASTPNSIEKLQSLIYSDGYEGIDGDVLDALLDKRPSTSSKCSSGSMHVPSIAGLSNSSKRSSLKSDSSRFSRKGSGEKRVSFADSVTRLENQLSSYLATVDEQQAQQAVEETIHTPASNASFSSIFDTNSPGPRTPSVQTTSRHSPRLAAQKASNQRPQKRKRSDNADDEPLDSPRSLRSRSGKGSLERKDEFIVESKVPTAKRVKRALRNRRGTM